MRRWTAKSTSCTTSIKHHADAIEAIITEIEEGEETSDPEPEEEDEEEEEEERPWGVFDLSDKEDIYTRYTEVDVHRYEENLLRDVQNGVDAASNFDSTPIDFDSVNSTINELKNLGQNISITIGFLEQKIHDLEAKLPDCSPEVAEGIRYEIQDLQKLLDYKDEFLNTCALIENHGCREQNEQNRTNMETVSEALRQAGNDVLSGEARPDDKDCRRAYLWNGTISGMTKVRFTWNCSNCARVTEAQKKTRTRETSRSTRPTRNRKRRCGSWKAATRARTPGIFPRNWRDS